MAKTDKAKLLHYYIDDVPDADMPTVLDETLFIEDGNAVAHALKGLPGTFKETFYKLADQLSWKKNCVFSTDMYVDGSVKSQELLRRGSSQKIILNVNTRMPASFAEFLRNSQNKTQMIQLMLKVLSDDSSAPHLADDRKFILIVEGTSTYKYVLHFLLKI